MTVPQQELEPVSVRAVAVSKAATVAAKTAVMFMAAASGEMFTAARRAGKDITGYCADGRSFSPERVTVSWSAYETQRRLNKDSRTCSFVKKYNFIAPGLFRRSGKPPRRSPACAFRGCKPRETCPVKQTSSTRQRSCSSHEPRSIQNFCEHRRGHVN